MAVESAGLIALAAGITMAGASIATAYAEKGIGSAAVGAIVEKEETFSKVLILTVIPETIVIFGLVVSILILGKIV